MVGASVFAASVLACVVYISYKAYLFASYLRKVLKTPGPSLVYLIRNSSQIASNGLEQLLHFCWVFNFKAWRITFPRTIFFFSDPDDVAKVLRDRRCDDKSQWYYGEVEDFWGKSIFTENGDQLKRHREALSPGFNEQSLQSYLPTFNEQARVFLQSLRRFKAGSEINMLHEFKYSYTKTVMKTTIQAEGEEYGDSHVVSTLLEDLLKYCYLRSFSPIYYYLRHRFHPKYRDDVIFRDVKFGIRYKDLVLKRKREVERLRHLKNFVPSSVLDHMVVQKTCSKLTDEMLVSEIMAILAASVNTVPETSALSLALLALHPSIQRQVIDEIDSIFGGSSRPATSEDLSRMVHLERVIQETMRLFPASPIIFRDVKSDLCVNGVCIPEGCIAAVVIKALHRNPKCFENPDEFIPDRFLSNNVHGHAYIPFSAGDRSCLGNVYGMILMKIYLSTFFRRYRVLPSKHLRSLTDIEVNCDYTIRLPKGILLQVCPIKEAEDY